MLTGCKADSTKNIIPIGKDARNRWIRLDRISISISGGWYNPDFNPALGNRIESQG